MGVGKQLMPDVQTGDRAEELKSVFKLFFFFFHFFFFFFTFYCYFFYLNTTKNVDQITKKN